MRYAPLLIAAPWALACQLALAQEPQKRQPIDPTPPPLGTSSYTPPPAVAEEPLTARTFVVRAGLANMAETELSQLALARSGNAEIQAYARKMVQEHGAAQAKLRAAAAEAKVALPGTLDKQHQETKDALTRLHAQEFDAGYIKAMVAGHDAAVALFDAAAHSPTLPKVLQSYAIGTLPIIRAHRDAAYALNADQSR
jgi:putative membrane protein